MSPNPTWHPAQIIPVKVPKPTPFVPIPVRQPDYTPTDPMTIPGRGPMTPPSVQR